MPRRGWSNLYTQAKAHEEPTSVEVAGDRSEPPIEVDAASVSRPEPVAGAGSAGGDAASRVIRDGYRIVEDNLRRGKQVAAELRGAGREVGAFASKLEPQKLVTDFSRAVFDPALTNPLVELAKAWMGLVGVALPNAGTPSSDPGIGASGAREGRPSAAAPVERARVGGSLPLHPQARPGYADSGAVTPARLVKLRQTGPGEWLGDVEIQGKLRRVQLRALDEEL